jgi:hypothetical protein
MTLTRREIAGDDILVMQSLTQRLWSPHARWHIGDLAWQRSSARQHAADWRTAVWMSDDACVGWGWVELPGELSLNADRSHPDLVAEVLDWFETVVPGGERSCTVLGTERHLVAGLTAAGYRARLDGPYFRHHSVSLERLPQPLSPQGFRLRYVRPDEAEARAAAHRAGWSDFGSTLSTERYATVMSSWPYRLELDWVAEAPDGELVASALGWLDEANAAGLIEPVGCAPRYRRMGLASAVNLATLHAMRALGARTGHVNPRGDDGYPVPGRLYRSIGFRRLFKLNRAGLVFS